MKDIEISSKELKQMNKVVPKRANDFSKYTFWYYTSYNTANLIFENSEIYISNINKMNDLDEIELHKKDSACVHCLCLCNSKSEKIPMWYLYAGIAGKGISIGFTPAKMIKFLNNIDELITPDETTLYKDKDFSMESGWVFYRKSAKNNKIFYKSKWYSLDDPEEFAKDNYFIKSYPWEYEREFRMVFHNKTTKKYDYLKLNVGSVIDKLKIQFAPEITTAESTLLLSKNIGFQKIPSSKIKHSSLGIKMDLCKRNFSSFLDYINMNIENPSIDTGFEVDKICALIQSKCKYNRKDTKDNVNI